MPVIPTYINQVGVANNALSAQGPTVLRQDQGLEAIANVADVVSQGAQLYAKIDEQQIKREAVNLLSQNTFDETYYNTKQQASADGSGFTDQIREAHAAYRDSVLQQTEDPSVRRLLAQHLDQDAPRYLRAAVKEQYSMRSAYDVDQTNQAISSLQNGVMSNPMQYETNLALGRQVIENAPVDQANKSKMARTLAENLASTRFDGMIARAKTPNDIESIKADFSQKDWTGSMKPTDYERITKQLEEKKNALGARLDAEGEAFLAATGKRTSDYATLDDNTRAELSALVRRAPGTKNSIKAAQVLRNQTFLDQNGDKTLPELRQTVEGLRVVAQQPSAVPPRVMEVVTSASAMGDGSITPSYLLGVAQAEYGRELAKGAGADYGKKTDLAGSSTGLFQFTDKTWLGTPDKPGLMRDPRVLTRLGINTAGMSDQEILDLRKIPEVAAKGALVLAEQNKAYMERAFGRDISDNELYMAHFLGAQDAVKFLSAYQVAPYAQARDVVPDAADANAPLFPNGATLKDVYDNLSHRVGTSQAAIAYNDLGYAEGLLAKAEKAAKDGKLVEYEMERHPNEQIVKALNLSDPSSFSERGVLVETLSRKHGVPASKINPFVGGEAETFAQKLEDANADERITVLSNLSRLGAANKYAFKSLGEAAPRVGYAARMVEGEHKDEAKLVLIGHYALKNDKATKALLGSEGGYDTLAAFNSKVRNALDGLPPEEVSAIRSAAEAHYVATNRGDKSAAFSASKFKESIDAVLGGQLAKVNGDPVVLPAHVSADEMKAFLGKATLEDAINFSKLPMGVPPSPPSYADGAPVSAYDLYKAGRLVAVGGNKYEVHLSDGKPAAVYLGTDPVTHKPSFTPFLLEINSDKVKAVLSRGARP